MREIYIRSNVGLLDIGRRGENIVTRVHLPEVPESGQAVTVYVLRNGDTAAYPASEIEITDTEIIWTVTSVDTGKSGRGKVQYRFADSVTGKVIKTEIYHFVVGLAIDTEVGPAPDPYETWLDSLTDLAGETQINAHAAESAAESASASAEAASASAESASGSASQASGKATEAAGSATTASQKASEAALSATQAINSAVSAADSERGAVAKAAEAAQSAESAGASATSAEGSAESASASADSASESKTDAETASQSAHEWGLFSQTYASQAAASATSAGQSATTATTKASEASASATTAATKASEASASATAAQEARTGAETAQASAESAAQAAQAGADAVGLLKEQIYNSYPNVEAETGPIVSISDGADGIPVKSLVVDINPVQDLHGQDSPYPAGGGKNILPYASQDTDSKNGITWTKNSDGSITFSGTCSASAAMTFVEFKLPAGDYLFSNVGSTFAYTGGNRPIVYIRDLDNAATLASIGFGQTANGLPFSLSIETNIRFYVVFQTDNVVSGTLYPMIRLSTVTDSSYAPYSNIYPITGWTGASVTRTNDKESTDPDYVEDTISVDWQSTAGTVYGGSLDVTKGVLTVDRAMVDMGMLEFKKDNGNDNLFYSQKAPLFGNGGNALLNNALNGYNDISEIYMNDVVALTNPVSGRFCVANSQANPILRVCDSRFTDANTFNSAMSGIKAVFMLYAPITYQLTPTEVKTLLGTNNVWADTGDTSLAYRADPKLYIDGVYEEYQDDLADYASALAALG